MVEVENLRVSLTKNGYLKIAQLIEGFPGNEILENCYGVVNGVNLIRSQVANILCADEHGTVPPLWDQLREHDRATIRAVTFVAIVFAHVDLIRAFQGAGRGRAAGVLLRSEMAEKQYTNLQFAMAEVGLCRYARGMDEIHYDMTPLNQHLAGVGDLVRELFRAKLRRCGWRDPEQFRVAPDMPLAEQCIDAGFNEVFGMTARNFSQWLSGRPTRPR